MLLLLCRIVRTLCMRCGLLPQMSHVAWSVCLCVLVTRLSCVKMAESIEMPFGWLTCLGPRNYVSLGSMGVYSSHGKGQFLGVVPSTGNHWESLLRCMQQTKLFGPR